MWSDSVSSFSYSMALPTAIISATAPSILLAYGAWLIYPPAGFVVAGALCLFWSWLVARYLDRTQSSVGGGK